MHTWMKLALTLTIDKLDSALGEVELFQRPPLHVGQVVSLSWVDAMIGEWDDFWALGVESTNMTFQLLQTQVGRDFQGICTTRTGRVGFKAKYHIILT